MQYVRETTLPLHERVNLHRSTKAGCEHVISFFKDVCVGSSFVVQINKIFPGTGYKNNKICPVNRETRLDREDYWIESLWTSYPYGLNERKRKADPNLSVGCSFSYALTSWKRSARCRNNVNFDNFKNMESIFNCIHNNTTYDIKNEFYNIRILLNNTRKKYLTQCNSLILDTSDTKTL